MNTDNTPKPVPIDAYDGQWVPEKGTPAYIADHGILAQMRCVQHNPTPPLAREEVARIRDMANATFVPVPIRRAIPDHLRFRRTPSDPFKKRAKWVSKQHWDDANAGCSVVRSGLRPELYRNGSEFSTIMETDESAVCANCREAFLNS